MKARALSPHAHTHMETVTAGAPPTLPPSVTVNVSAPATPTTPTSGGGGAFPPYTAPAQVPTLRQLHEEKVAVGRELAESKDAVSAGAVGAAFTRSPYWTAIIVVAVVFFLLYAIQPSIVKEDSGDKVSVRKVAGWSLLAGVAVVAIPWVCRAHGFKLPWQKKN